MNLWGVTIFTVVKGRGHKIFEAVTKMTIIYSFTHGRGTLLSKNESLDHEDWVSASQLFGEAAQKRIRHNFNILFMLIILKE